MLAGKVPVINATTGRPLPRACTRRATKRVQAPHSRACHKAINGQEGVTKAPSQGAQRAAEGKMWGKKANSEGEGIAEIGSTCSRMGVGCAAGVVEREKRPCRGSQQ